MAVGSERNYDGPQRVPFAPERQITKIYWGEILADGGLSSVEKATGEYIQMPFMWDPRCEDWVSVSEYVYHFGIEDINVPSSQGNFVRHIDYVGGGATPNPTVPGSGYITMAQVSYTIGTLNADHILRTTITVDAAFTSSIVSERPFPAAAMSGYPKQALLKFDPPIRLTRHDLWTFELVSTGAGGTSCSRPFLDVYFRFRYEDPLVGGNLGPGVRL